MNCFTVAVNGDQDVKSLNCMNVPLASSWAGRQWSWLTGQSFNAKCVRVLLQGAQHVVAGVSAYELFKNYNSFREGSDSDKGADTAFLTSLASLSILLIGSTTAAVVRCKVGKRTDQGIVTSPMSLATVVLITGVASMIAARQQAAREIARYETNHAEIESSLNGLIRGCIKEVYENTSFFTTPLCTACPIAGWKGPWGSESIVQAYVQDAINVTLCEAPAYASIWPYLHNISVNTTVSGEPWPCGGVYDSTSSSTTLKEEELIHFLAREFDWNLPLVLDVKEEGICKALTGFATRLFDLTELCNVNVTQLPAFDMAMPCMTLFAVYYFSSHVAEVGSLAKQELPYPGEAYSVLDSNQFLILIGAAAFFLCVTIAFHMRECRWDRERHERLPLLESQTD